MALLTEVEVLCCDVIFLCMTLSENASFKAYIHCQRVLTFLNVTFIV